MLLKRTFLLVMGFLMMLFIVACGNSTGGGPYGSGTSSSSTTTGSSTSSALVKTATATVKGKSQTILTDAQGKTLYYFTPDTATTSACTGSCAQKWPALLMTGSSVPTSATPLSGKLTTQTTVNGTQVEYNGHLLYTFAGDNAPGQTNGEGIGGKWFVCTPDLAAGSNASGSSTSSTALIKTATAMVQGKSETILTTAQGKTLYYFTPDTATTSACTGSCAHNWPALLMTGSGSPTSASTLSGTLSTQTTTNGTQVEYNGHLLYTFVGDNAPGQTNGQGIAGKWFVATPSLAVLSGGSSKGYGY